MPHINWMLNKKIIPTVWIYIVWNKSRRLSIPEDAYNREKFNCKFSNILGYARGFHNSRPSFPRVYFASGPRINFTSYLKATHQMLNAISERYSRERLCRLSMLKISTRFARPVAGKYLRNSKLRLTSRCRTNFSHSRWGID